VTSGNISTFANDDPSSWALSIAGVDSAYATPEEPGVPTDMDIGSPALLPMAACDAVVTSVASVKAHGGGVGPLPVFYDPDVAGEWLVTESRDVAAAQQIVITFSTSVGPDGSLAGVSASGGMSVDTATLSDGGLTLTLDVSGAADGNAYTIDLSAALPDCPAGSETIVVRQCYGNTSGDNTINNIDKSQVAGKNGTAADASTCGDLGDEPCAFLDVSLDGTVNNIDKSAVAGLNGTACPAP
jgi:hypothetical protein